MSINATLLGQMITFALFVWFTMRFVWPLVQHTLATREQKIADGLAAAELGQQEMQEAHINSRQVLKQAHAKAEVLLAQAQQQADDIIASARVEADQEKQHILSQGADEVQQAYQEAQRQLRGELAGLVTVATEKLLGRALTAQDEQYLHSQVLQ